MICGIQRHLSSTSSMATERSSEKAHRLDQLRKPYEALGLTYDCASSQASPHQVRVYVSETFYEPFYPYISKELIDFIGLARGSLEYQRYLCLGDYPE